MVWTDYWMVPKLPRFPYRLVLGSWRSLRGTVIIGAQTIRDLMKASYQKTSRMSIVACCDTLSPPSLPYLSRLRSFCTLALITSDMVNP